MAIPIEYSNYSNVFSAEYVAKLLEYTGINNHVIEQEEGKQISFVPIYSLGLVGLEIVKTYIEANLANYFMWSFKSLVGAFIFLIKS